MNLTRKIYLTRREKIIDFIIGFVGVILVNFVFTILSGGIIPLIGQGSNLSWLIVCLSFLPWVVNLGVIIIAAFTRHWIALGALAVPVVGFIIGLCVGVVVAVLCFTSGGFHP